MDTPKKIQIVKKKDPDAVAEPESKSDPAYEVGFGKPPKHTQFKPGQSGNPKGKPKGTKHLNTIINEEANKKIEIKEGGKVKKITKKRAVIKSVLAKAIKGDTKSASTALNLIGEIDAKMLEDKDVQEAYSKEDLEVLNNYVALQKLLKGASGE